MIITRAPYRVSLFGGGTDYPAWYEKHGSTVLSATLDKYCYIGLREMPPFLGAKYLVYYAKSEKVNRVLDIEHPAVRGCLIYLNEDRPLEINHMGDLPARSGLGSSSAFTVALLQALHTMRGEERNKDGLAREAIEVEQKVIGETVGVQDQIAAAFGGINSIVINKEGAFTVSTLVFSDEEKAYTQKHFLLVYTGKQRYASEIADEQVARMDNNETRLRAIADLVGPATDALSALQIDEFGQLLGESWNLKRGLSEKITEPRIDTLYEEGIRAGMWGGKLLGAGAGGFMLFCGPPEVVSWFKGATAQITIPVTFGKHGCRIVLAE